METGLLPALETALSSCLAHVPSDGRSRLPHLSTWSRQRLLLTLLFLQAVGLHRPWQLRSYTGEGLALLTFRSRAYGYSHTERFLSHLAQANGAAVLTDALAKWTAQLWTPAADMPAAYYIDGHRKPVYTDTMIPRGLVGRLGTILGSRALALLHDERGHPLLAVTHRGDQHLTKALPTLLARYEQASGASTTQRIIVDREGLAASFLSSLKQAGRTVISVLRTDQYTGLDSFTQIGAFVPLQIDSQGKVVREVALASFALPLPDHPGESLPLSVALIRDLRKVVAVCPTKQESRWPEPWYADLDYGKRAWWEPGWQATAAPAGPTTAKLIPIVSTAPCADAVDLAQTYIHRWAAQENIIKDWLLPLGLDVNHGYGKTPVENSEVARRRTALEKRLANVQRWAQKAGERRQQAEKRSERWREQTRVRTDALYRVLNQRQDELIAQGEIEYLWRHEIRQQQKAVDAEIEQMRERERRAHHEGNQEFRKQERYCQEQRELLRALEDLKAGERAMHELDNRKDQVMTVLKVALTNLMMWTRERYFPASYAHATYKRLAPFFQLAGHVQQSASTVSVELHPFNDRQYNRDLTVLCERVNAAALHLPDGRRFLLAVSDGSRPILDGQHRYVG